MHGERELTTGLLSKDASFRLIVSGNIGAKEIDRLIRKLELDKEILAEVAESVVGANQTAPVFSGGSSGSERYYVAASTAPKRLRS